MKWIDKFIFDEGRRELVINSVNITRISYLTSFYWATATITSTGFGDLHPRATLEKIFAISAMLISKFEDTIVDGCKGVVFRYCCGVWNCPWWNDFYIIKCRY